MSEAVSSVSNAQSAQQTQNVSQSSAANQALETPNASAVQAFNNNSDISANTSPPVDDLFGDQTPVTVDEITAGEDHREFRLDNGRDHVWRTENELKEGWESFKDSENYPLAETEDLVESPWGEMVSSSALTAYYNHIIDNRPIAQ